jgi:DNA-binding response OmpR family regulator/anti-sigma regulatory factor (Ser/Thr protein kinase)
MEAKKAHDEQKLNQERIKFFTNITHELRTPLTLILGPLEDLTNDKKLPAQYQSRIKNIHISALRLLNLVNKILEFRKSETKNRKLVVTKGDITSIVTEIGLRFKELNHNKNVIFEINTDDSIPIIYFDSEVITTILTNLLSNAIKYTPVGKIALSLSKDDEHINISVADTGYGIEQSAIPHIFDRYYQAEGKHQASGTGIGLAIVKSLVDLHDGDLKVESNIGQGTTFCFKLLIANTYPDALHKEITKDDVKKNTEAIKIENEDNRGIILVVEDNNDIREYITLSFSDNYKIFQASNGIEGLNMAQDNIPDLIISDIMMPEMDGIEMCKRVKNDVRTSHIPIILLTAKDSISDKEEGYDSGADSYLTKPFSANLLKSRVNNLLESRKKLATIIAEKTRSIRQSESKEEKVLQLNKLDTLFLEKLTNTVENNVENDHLDISFLTSEMHMSTSSLYRKIKGLTGMSANIFIRKIRLRHSLRLMSEEGLNVSEAAYTCGFSDVAYFRSCFKEEYGTTPKEYIKQMKDL